MIRELTARVEELTKNQKTDIVFIQDRMMAGSNICLSLLTYYFKFLNVKKFNMITVDVDDFIILEFF
jgi:hypothetical protein